MLSTREVHSSRHALPFQITPFVTALARVCHGFVTTDRFKKAHFFHVVTLSRLFTPLLPPTPIELTNTAPLGPLHSAFCILEGSLQTNPAHTPCLGTVRGHLVRLMVRFVFKNPSVKC